MCAYLSIRGWRSPSDKFSPRAVGLLALLLIGLSGSSCQEERRSVDNASTKPAPLSFSDVAVSLGIDYVQSHNARLPLTILETAGSGCAFLDFDQDGQLDVLLIGQPRCALYRQSDGQFEDWTRRAGLFEEGHWAGVAVGDINNDGWPDLFINGYQCGRLYVNQRGRFVDQTKQLGFPDQTQWGTGAAFFDADNDGWLDLICNYYVEFGPTARQYCEVAGERITCPPRFYQAQRSRLYRNVQGRRFEDVTRQAGLSRTFGKTWAALPFDFNADGRMDLYCANDLGPADLWRNEGNFQFVNVAGAAGVALGTSGRPMAGMGLDVGDVNGDGLLDLWCTTFQAEDKTLFQNMGNGTFQEIGRQSDLVNLRPYVSWGTVLEDFDNDGTLDIAVLNGHVIAGEREKGDAYPQRSRLFRGLGGGRFEDVSAQAGEVFDRRIVGRGLAAGDYDDDGRVDLLAMDAEGRALLLHNETASAITNGWLKIRVQSPHGGRAALGARVTLIGSGAKQVKEIRTARSVFSASDAVAHFGLATDTGPFQIEVRWPEGLKRTITVEKQRQTVSISPP